MRNIIEKRNVYGKSAQPWPARGSRNEIFCPAFYRGPSLRGEIIGLQALAINPARMSIVKYADVVEE